MTPGEDARSRATLIQRSMGILLGVVLARSAFAHLANSYAFLDIVLGYRLVTGYPAMIAAYLIPPLQLSLSVALILGWWPRESLALAAIMFAVFVAVQLSVVFRGLDVSCGCFGMAESVRIDARTIGFSAVCCLIAVLGWWLTPKVRDLVTP